MAIQDPYPNFRFRVSWDGRVIPGISEVSPLRRETEVVQFREGGDPSGTRKLPGLSLYDAVVLERPLSADTAFEDWAKLVGGFPSGAPADKFRKDVQIELLDETGQPVRVYAVVRCWPSEYQAFSDLDAAASLTALERIRLENEGFERVA
jgi:phage tail-like protein